MKKFHIIISFIFVILTCLFCTSCTNTDIKLIDQYLENYFSPVKEVDDFISSEKGELYLTSVEIPRLKKVYIVHITYMGNGDILSIRDGSANYLHISPEALSTDYTEITLTVKAGIDSLYEKTFKKTFRYKPYTNYFGNILVDSARMSYDHVTNENGKTIISKSYIDNARFHTNYLYLMGFNKNTFEYHCVEYERMLGSTHNLKKYEAVCYFDSNNPRIEGLTIGTYYIGQGEFNSTDSKDKEAYKYSKKVNEIFKKYSDSRHIQNFD